MLETRIDSGVISVFRKMSDGERIAELQKQNTQLMIANEQQQIQIAQLMLTTAQLQVRGVGK